MARKRAYFLAAVLVIAVVVVVGSTGKGVWEWAVYSNYRPGPVRHRWEKDSAGRIYFEFQYFSSRRMRWSWLPGNEEQLEEISRGEYYTLLEKKRIRWAKGGQ